MSHHWIKPKGGGLFCINCGEKRVCGCAIDLNLWTSGHDGNCQLHLSKMPSCQPTLVTSEALMFAEKAGIPWPEERPYEQTLSDSDGDLG